MSNFYDSHFPYIKTKNQAGLNQLQAAAADVTLFTPNPQGGVGGAKFMIEFAFPGLLDDDFSDQAKVAFYSSEQTTMVTKIYR